MIFVVDSSNRARLQEAHNELAKLVQEKQLKEASLLIFANKQVGKYFFVVNYCNAFYSNYSRKKNTDENGLL